MAHTTPTYALPVPDETDTADVPRDISALAVQLDGTTLPLFETLAHKAVASGYASLDATGKVPAAQLPAAAASGATVASTIAGLGAGVDGKIGLIVTGTEILYLIYSATAGKWISPPVVAGSPTGQQATSGVNWVGLNHDLRFPWSALQIAGLKVQARGLIEGVDTQNDQNGCNGRFVRYTNSVPAAANGVSVAQTNFGAMNYLAHQSGMIDWTDLAMPAANYAMVQLQASTQDSNNHSGAFWGTLWMRFTS
jgi:hypothetical protein